MNVAESPAACRVFASLLTDSVPTPPISRARLITLATPCPSPKVASSAARLRSIEIVHSLNLTAATPTAAATPPTAAVASAARDAKPAPSWPDRLLTAPMTSPEPSALIEPCNSPIFFLALSACLPKRLTPLVAALVALDALSTPLYSTLIWT